jgi:hypothetical protein
MAIAFTCGTALLIMCGAPLRELSTEPSDGKRPISLSFHCNTGYTPEMCRGQLGRLRNLVSRFDLTPLGTWTWILVRSEDWQPILRQVGRDTDSPAFTILEKRQTFFEEALFLPLAGRTRRLLEKWRLPLDKLLEFAVTHELAHAICPEADERRTHALAAELAQTGSLQCDSLKSVKVSHTTLSQLVSEGHARSETFRGLVNALNGSGWLVFVQPGRCPERAALACLLHIVGTFEGSRYVRVIVDYRHRHTENVIATLAHELQHALEVAQSPEVKDAASVRALFERIGSVQVRSATATAYETVAARSIGEQVLRELDADAQNGASLKSRRMPISDRSR